MIRIRVLRACFVRESRWGRVRWVAAGWCVLFGLLYLVTGNTAFSGMAAVPAVPGALVKVLGWSWEYLVLPFIVADKARARRAMGVLAVFWFGWPVLAVFDRSDASEPGTVTKIRYCWMGSLAVMAGVLWMMAIGEWLAGRLPDGAARRLGRAPATDYAKADDETPKRRRVRAWVLIAIYGVLTVVAIAAGQDTPRLVAALPPKADPGWSPQPIRRN